MLLVSDIHDAPEALARVAGSGEPILILGDLLNFIDYRTGEGIVAEILGHGFARRVAEARGNGGDVRGLWRDAIDGYRGDFRAAVFEQATVQYAEAFRALGGAEVYLTYGNVDILPLLEEASGDIQILDGDVVEIEGWRVGFVGGTGRTLFDFGPPNPLEGRLDALGPVDILCTHVAPAIPALCTDVITGRPERSSEALLGYLEREQPAFHFFGDIHQPVAREWQIGATRSQNVGYFRATGLPTRHAARGRAR